MESSCSSGEVESNRLRDYINVSVDPEKGLLPSHDWSNHCRFCTLIMIRENIEDGLKSGKLTYIEALQTIVEKCLETPVRKPKSMEERNKAEEKAK